MTLAQAYGRDAYGRNTYTCAEGDTSCSTETPVPKPPLTGLAQEQPAVFYGGLIVLAVALYLATLWIIKTVRSRRGSK